MNQGKDESIKDISGTAIPLTRNGFNSTVNYLGVEEAVIWAVIYNEAVCGYLPDRRPVILYERHKFHQFTNGLFDLSTPSVSLTNPGGYGAGGEHQYTRLRMAASLDRTAAYRSTSWGLTQIMGCHAEELGYMNVYAMVNSFAESEDNQLYAFSQFCYRYGLVDSLIERDWEAFSRGYNGSGYRKNKYDVRLEANYKRFSRRLPDVDVRRQQVYCYYNNLLSLYDIDGINGPITEEAVRKLNSTQC